MLFLGYFDGHGFIERFNRQIGMFHDRSAKSGGGLIQPLGVDQVDITGFTDADIFHQGAEYLGIDGGSQNPLIFPFPAEYGNDEMRFLTETREHVTDVKPFLHHLFEPCLPGIHLVNQVIGADIGRWLPS